MRYVLSIQGGGIRGIIPCLALAKLEEQLGCPTRDWLKSHNGMVAGTSTGALLAACVAAGVPAAEALKTYTEQGPEIFSPTNDVARKLKLITAGYQFDNQVLAAVVRATLPNPDAIINDLPIRILITATASSGDPWYFIKDGAHNAKTTGRYKLLDAAVASACATTYHAQWLIPGLGYFADGGCGGLADPVYQACVEAFCYDDFEPAETRVINLGTGFYAPPAPPGPPSGLLANISWVVGSLVGSSKTFAEQAVDRHWPRVLISFNPALPSDIDEADVNQIGTLLSIGQAAADKMDWRQV